MADALRFVAHLLLAGLATIGAVFLAYGIGSNLASKESDDALSVGVLVGLAAGVLLVALLSLL